MFCIKCGAENKDAAAYCRKCGAAIEEEETRVAVRQTENGESRTDNEEPIFSITPTLLFVKMGYVAAAVGALFFVALASAFAYLIVPVWLAIILGLGLLLIPAFYHIRQKLVRYTLTPSTLEIDEGLISRTTRRVPLRRIQDVTVSATVMQRLLGLGDVTIDNASDDGGKLVLKNINTPRDHADRLLSEMGRSGDI
ncbi:MAG: PH domain-containing protein [Chloracidobacterium sp.]|nr:PH domain-containing protein [Chloracidobacterium sp.]